MHDDVSGRGHGAMFGVTVGPATIEFVLYAQLQAARVPMTGIGGMILLEIQSIETKLDWHSCGKRKICFEPTTSSPSLPPKRGTPLF